MILSIVLLALGVVIVSMGKQSIGAVAIGGLVALIGGAMLIDSLLGL